MCWQCAPGCHCCCCCSCCFFFVLITSFVVVTGCCCCCRLLGTTGIINIGWGEPTPRRAKLAYSLPLFMNEEGVLARSYSHSHSHSSTCILIVINNCINATAFADKLSIIHLAISYPFICTLYQYSWVVFDSCKQVFATFAWRNSFALSALSSSIC